MNVCANNRQKLALLAIDALEAPEAEELRAHVAACSGCRDYLREITHVAEKIHAAESPEVELNPFLHRRVRNRLLERQPRAVFPWKLLIPAMAAMAFVLFVFPREQKNLPIAIRPETTPVPSVAATSNDSTVLNYQTVANKSFDALDALLNRQGDAALPSAPVYRAGFANAGE